MIIYVFKTQEELNQVGAGLVTSLVQMNPRAVLGLATGGTPIGIYEEIVKTYNKGLVSFKNVSTYNLDEYVGISEDHPESYVAYIKKHLFDLVDIPAEQTNLPNGRAKDLEKECAEYDKKLEKVNQVDLQILGIGHNGHIGFNEPGHELISGTHVVELKEETREANARFFNSIDEVPKQAVTMGVGTIMKAKTLVLVVRGADKAEIVHRALTGPVTTEIPASLLQMHPNLIVLLDAEAGRLFK